MGLGILIFLSSGLFLGWSLGANDAANVFGTAVGSRMVKFRTAAAICGICVLLGAVVSGAGAAQTIGRLGAISALGGAFTVALAAGLVTFSMTRAGLPVSVSQAVVGAILGWNIYTATPTDNQVLVRIVLTWVLSPVLAGAIAALMYLALRRLLARTKPHLLRQDAMVRTGLIVAGAFGSYSLGANNIGNVVGVFAADNPFRPVSVGGLFTVGAAMQLFLLGGLATAIGVFTYSQRVIRTVGSGLMRLSPEAALVVVMAQSLVLFLFASRGLESALRSVGLPTFPLVPVSSSQAVVGAILGLGLLKGGRTIRWRLLGDISLGWVITPIAAGVVSFFLLFFVENVFDQPISRPMLFRLDATVREQVAAEGLPAGALAELDDREYVNGLRLQTRLEHEGGLSTRQAHRVVDLARVTPLTVDLARIDLAVDAGRLNLEQSRALRSLTDRRFNHTWELADALAKASPLWRLRSDTAANRLWNRDLRQKLAHVEEAFRDREQ
jgi:PiT family inorganic phosphate transporter